MKIRARTIITFFIISIVVVLIERARYWITINAPEYVDQYGIAVFLLAALLISIPIYRYIKWTRNNNK